jgi:hypothetical protein
MNEQLGFNFDGTPTAESSLDLWREQRRAQMESLASRSGLPIGHRVRACLISGLLIEGKLELVSNELWIDQRRSADLRLQIGRVDFTPTEVESCVRID